MSIAGKAAIIGAGCSAFAEHWTKSAEDLVVDAVLEAYADAGIVEPRRQIDAVFAGSLYAPMGPVHVTEALKLYKPTTMVYNYCATGTEALRAAVMAVASGAHETVLAVGFDKPKDRGVSGPSGNIRLVRAVRRAVLRAFRRRARGSRAHRGEEPPQRHAGAEELPEKGDNGRGSAGRAPDRVALRPL